MLKLLLAVCLALAFSGTSAAQDHPRWEIYGGYAAYLAGGESGGGAGQYFTNGVQASLARSVTSYFRVVGEFNAQFMDHVVDLAPLPPGSRHLNSKELLGLFGPEATYRGLKKFDIFGHYLVGVSYGRDNHFPKIPTATYTTWGQGIGFGVDWKVSHRVAIRLLEGDWIQTHYPKLDGDAEDNWRISSGFVFRLGH